MFVVFLSFILTFCLFRYYNILIFVVLYVEPLSHPPHFGPYDTLYPKQPGVTTPHPSVNLHKLFSLLLKSCSSLSLYLWTP